MSAFACATVCVRVTCGNGFNDGYDVRVDDGLVEIGDVHGEDDLD